MHTLKVLIIDDDYADRMIYKDFLSNYSNYKFDFAEANDAQKGLDLYEKFKPDCIILDYMLPGINGLEFIKNIRQKSYEQPPIFMLSGYEDVNLEKTALENGAVNYLSKKDMFPGKLNKGVIDTIVNTMIERKNNKAE